MKESEFKKWELETFGYGYGTGEPYVLQILQNFLSNCPNHGNYDYKELENFLGPQIVWLLINTLARSEIIEYGTSPRFGWLTEKGIELKEFLNEKGIEKVLEILDSEEDEEAIEK